MYGENKNVTSNKTLNNIVYYFESLVLNSINKKLEE